MTETGTAERLFKLTTVDDKPVLMRDGTPFIYTSKRLAWIAKCLLEDVHKQALRIRPITDHTPKNPNREASPK